MFGASSEPASVMEFGFIYVQAQKAGGVISASAGNHALALAYHGHDLHIAVTVVMPHITPLMKLELCRQLGATIVVHGNSFFEVN